MSKKIERLVRELAAADAEAARTEDAAKVAREAFVAALADGVGVEAARKAEAAARTACADAQANADALREALARVKREEEEAARAADVAELTADARKFARETDESLRSGAAKVAAGLVEIGRAFVAAAEAENADSALASLNAPPAGRGRLMNTEAQDALSDALLRAYTAADRGVTWTESFRIDLAPLRCAAK